MKILPTVWFRRLQSSSLLSFKHMHRIATPDHGRLTNWLLLVAIFMAICAVPLDVHAQQKDLVAKLKADAQRIVHVIHGDRAKSQAYCQINALGGQIDQAVQEKDELKADGLVRKKNDLEKTLGPEYIAFFDALNNLDQNPKEFRDIWPLFDTLKQSCPH
jgi:hypothetical protein